MILHKLHFNSKKKVPHIFQSEVAECGQTCLAMIAGYYGHNVTMSEMRSKYPSSTKGTNLTDIIRIADALGFAARPVKMEMEHLNEIKLPAILHWNFSHYVVLTKVNKDSVEINDPAQGIRVHPLSEVSKHFTGIGLELTPSDKFTKKTESAGLSLGQLIGKVHGLFAAGSQILLAALLLEAAGLLLPLMNQWIMDSVIPNADKSLLTVLGAGFSGLILIRTLLLACRDWSLTVFTTGLRAQVAEKVLRHTLKLPPQFFEKRRASILLNKFESLAEIERTLAASFVQTALDGAFSVLMIAVVFAYSTWLAITLLGASLLYAFVQWLLHGPTRQAQLTYVEAKSKESSAVLETLSAILPIQLADKTIWRLAQWEVFLAEETNAQVLVVRLMLLRKLANLFLFGLGGVLFLWIGAKEVLDNTLTLGELFAAISYQQIVSSRVTSLLDSISQIKLLSVQLDRLSDIVLAEPEPAPKPSIGDTGAENGLSFELQNVSFSYSPSEPLILNKVSLTIPVGESICIAGPSGGGKSTLLKLLLGVLTPTEGVILVNGKPLEDFGIHRLRELSSVVLQEDRLFYGTVADNISYFDPTAVPETIVPACMAAAIHQEIMAMPMQYQSICGEGSSSLSGGQRQRLFLARALYRKPKALFLDEATSHLDLQTEAYINQSMKALSVTRIAVAHRPETIRTSDRVVVLLKGQIVADGKPEDILSKMTGG